MARHTENMKKSQKKNNFPAETCFLFFEDNMWTCWKCGRNHANCGHHIFGRGKEEGCEKSALNFAPLANMECHLPNHGWLMTDEGKKEMLEKTIAHLSSIEYTLTEIDNQFLEKYGLEIYKLRIKL